MSNMSIADLVTPRHIEEYSANGATCVRGAFGPEWIEMLTDGLDANVAAPSERGRFWNRSDDGQTTFYDSQVWRTNANYRRFVLESPMAEIAGRVMQVEAVNFFFDAVFVRSTGTQFRTPFHQDEPYWSVDGFDCSSAWMPLMSCEKRSSLELVRGSHRWNARYQQTNFGALTADVRDQVNFATEDREPFPDVDNHPERFDIISWETEPGDVVVFNARMIHGGSGRLAPDRDLKVFNTQWLGDDVRVDFKPEGMDPDHSEVMTAAGLRPGDRVGGDLYPELWRRERV